MFACAASIGLLLGRGAVRAAPALDLAVANTDDEIVYLDPGGVIRVLDPRQAAGSLAVQWFSPTGGWTGFALSDVNLDGDAEIVAIGSSGGAGKLTIFDPVSSRSEAGSGGFINGIPWSIRHDRTLLGIPRLVATGELNLAVPGDEIVVNYTLPSNAVIVPGDTFRFEGLIQTGSARDGSTWGTRRVLDTGNPWTWIGLGNLNGTGEDEIVLIDDEHGNLSVFVLVADGAVRVYRNSDVDNAWKHAAIGQFAPGGDEELAVVRETSYPLAAFFVIGYAGGTWSDVYSEYNDPPPSFVFLADLTGNGDQEAVLLREVPAELGGRVRLYVRNYGDDALALSEQLLDADNGYRAGVGADIDDDGRDEVVIMRGNRFRIFTEPERSNASQDFELPTAGRLVAAGNLDANGISGASRLGVTPAAVEDTLVAGASSQVYGVTVRDVTNGRIVAYTARIQNDSEWASLTPRSGGTPDNLYVTFQPRGLAAGVYEDTLIVETTDGSVVVRSVSVPLRLTIRAGASTSPARVDDLFYPCTGAAASHSSTLAITGTAGLAYTLSLSPTVSWAAVAPITGTVPATATLTVDPHATTATADDTLLVVSVPADGRFSATPIHMLCADNRILLPTVHSR